MLFEYGIGHFNEFPTHAIEFHNHLMVFLIAVASFVVWLLFRCLSYYGYHGNVQTSLSNYDENFTHSTVLEVVWTIVPALILMVIVLGALIAISVKKVDEITKKE